MQNSLIEQGLDLMLFGMGTVFVFLTVLVFATTLMSTLVNRWAPQQAPQADHSAATPATSIQPDATIIAVIQAAISKHRQQ